MVITQQPSGRNPCTDQTAVFEVTAVGALLSYQWRFDGAVIEGENDATLILNDVAPTDAGVYACDVASECGGFASSVAVQLVVSEAPPAIEVSPEGATLCVGDTHFMLVVVTGFAEFQWFKDGDPIPGAAQPFLVIPDASFEDAGAYFVLAHNGCGDAASESAMVEVIDCAGP